VLVAKATMTHSKVSPLAHPATEAGIAGSRPATSGQIPARSRKIPFDTGVTRRRTVVSRTSPPEAGQFGLSACNAQAGAEIAEKTISG